MPDVEQRIKEYIKEKTTETRDGIRVPLSRIAGELDYSTIAVWRAVQKLKSKRVIKVVKAENKTEPDKIYYLGEEDKLIDTIDELIKRINGSLLVLEELKQRIYEREEVIFELMREKK